MPGDIAEQKYVIFNVFTKKQVGPVELIEDFIKRDKVFRIPDLFDGTFADLKIFPRQPFVPLNNIDWPLLHEQKHTLLRIAAGEPITDAQRKNLQGIVHMIDDLQDFATDILKLPEKTVFPEISQDASGLSPVDTLGIPENTSSADEDLLDDEGYLTGAGIQAYVDACKNVCPYCGSEDIEGAYVNINSGHAHQEVTCNSCNASWEDIYKMHDITQHNPGDHS